VGDFLTVTQHSESPSRRRDASTGHIQVTLPLEERFQGVLGVTGTIRAEFFESEISRSLHSIHDLRLADLLVLSRFRVKRWFIGFDDVVLAADFSDDISSVLQKSTLDCIEPVALVVANNLL
jgi:hypothetical protein